MIYSFLIMCLIVMSMFNTLLNSWTQPDFLILIVIFMVSVLLKAQFDKTLTNKELNNYIYIGYLFRLLLLLFDIYGKALGHLPYSGKDTEWFFYRALRFSYDSFNTTEGMVVASGIFFRYIGKSRLFLQFLLMLESVFAIYLTVQCINKFDIQEKIKKNVIIYLCITPTYAIFSSLFLRESTISFLITLSIYFLFQWIEKRNEYNFWIACIFPLLASFLHSGASLVSLGIFVFRMFYNFNKKSISLNYFSIIILSLIGIGFLYFIVQNFDTMFRKFDNIESLEDIANTSITGGSSYAKYVGDSSSPLRFIIFSPLRMIMYQFSPLPWMIRNISDIIALSFNSFFYFISCIYLIQYLRKNKLFFNPYIFALIIIIFVCVFVFSWGCSNTGTAIRHRDKFITLHVLLLSLTSKELYKS